MHYSQDIGHKVVTLTGARPAASAPAPASMAPKKAAAAQFQLPEEGASVARLAELVGLTLMAVWPTDGKYYKCKVCLALHFIVWG